MFFVSRKKLELPLKEKALPGRQERMPVVPHHCVNGNPMEAPFTGMEMALFGMGCFWGAEKLFWEAPHVFSTAVGYAGGFTPNPTYKEVCSGMTGHNEVVRVAFDPKSTRYAQMLRLFWEGHNPTQGMQQGNDRGTQYRSGIYWYNEEQKRLAEASLEQYQTALQEAGLEPITTEILKAPAFYFAEDAHQQYLHKNPSGYCGLGGTGVPCALKDS